MEGRIRGSFPGGPSREGPSEERKRPPQLQRVEDIEAALARRHVRRSHEARRKRVIVGLVFSTVAAGGLGLVLGLRSRTTAEELTQVYEATNRPEDVEISKEVNRALLELWKMEDVEFNRNRRR